MPDVREVCRQCHGHGYVIGAEMAAETDHSRVCRTCRGSGATDAIIPMTYPRLMLPQVACETLSTPLERSAPMATALRLLR